MARENRLAIAPVWGALYRRAFPGYAGAQVVPRDTGDQKRGIDRYVHVEGGRRLAMQEKTRFGRDARDVLLELGHIKTEGKPIPGWLERTEASHLVMLWARPGVAYVWPMEGVRSAWARRGWLWHHKYGTRKAQNRLYVTVNVPVPIAEFNEVCPPVAHVKLPAALCVNFS